MSLRAVVVVLSVDGEPVSLNAIPAGVERVQMAKSQHATCAAAVVRHRGDVESLKRHLRQWAREHGWSVTVAPLGAA